MKKSVFLVGNEITVEQRSVHKTILKHASLLKNEVDQPVILTFDYNPDYDRVIRELQAIGHLSKQTSVMNLHNYYRDLYTEDGMTSEARAYYEKSRQKFEEGYQVEDGDFYARYFINGRYEKYKRWDDDGVLRVVDYFDETRVRIVREEFHPDGYKARETRYYPMNNKRNQENYYTPDGFCYLTIWFNYETGAQQQVFLFDPKVKKLQDFKNRTELQKHWLNEMCRLESVRPVVIAEDEKVAERVLKIPDKLADKMFMVNDQHLEAPYEVGGEIKKSMKSIVSAISKGYMTLVTTEQQKKDLHSDVGNRGNIEVLPYFAEEMPSHVDRNPHLFVIATNLVEDKQVHHAIEAMKQVVQSQPSALLEIYGSGREKDKLLQLVEELGLQEHVYLKPYTLNVVDVYQSALASIVTSKIEASNATYSEAAVQGTPTIAYDMKYGPAMHIVDGEDGLLVSSNDVDQLAQKMIYALENPQQLEKMGKAAKQKVLQLVDEYHYKEKFLSILNRAVQNSPKVNMV